MPLSYDDEIKFYSYIIEKGNYLHYGDGISRDGVKATYVTVAQYMLSSLGYDLGPTGIDGKFGNYTANAVKAFQRDHGLAVDGIIGPNTAEELIKAYVSAGRPRPKQPSGQLVPAPSPLPLTPRSSWGLILLGGLAITLIALFLKKKGK